MESRRPSTNCGSWDYGGDEKEIILAAKLALVHGLRRLDPSLRTPGELLVLTEEIR